MLDREKVENESNVRRRRTSDTGSIRAVLPVGSFTINEQQMRLAISSCYSRQQPPTETEDITHCIHLHDKPYCDLDKGKLEEMGWENFRSSTLQSRLVHLCLFFEKSLRGKRFGNNAGGSRAKFVDNLTSNDSSSRNVQTSFCVWYLVAISR